MVADTRINDPDVQRILKEANEGPQAVAVFPDVDGPPDTVFSLAAGYMADDGSWTKEFEVRELTGRDEEALARIPDVGRSLVAMIQRGTVRLGPDKATPEALDSLVGGDLDTILVAIRTVTFGPEVEIKPICNSCRTTYEATIDISKDLPIRTTNPEDLSWTVKGKKNTYEVSLYTAATQRRIFEEMSDDSKTIAVFNSEILLDSISSINGMPVLGMDAIRDLPMADRREILNSIQEHRVGPDLQGVKIKCPTCGHEQNFALNAAALFQ